MGYYDFPHTRNYDTDLGYLINWFSTNKDKIEKNTAITIEKALTATEEAIKAFNSATSASNSATSSSNSAALALELKNQTEALKNLMQDKIDQIDTNTNRINNLATIDPGSITTTADAELVDIRVGSNGKTYPSAGDSVRGQVSELKSDLSYLYNDAVRTILSNEKSKNAIYIKSNDGLTFTETGVPFPILIINNNIAFVNSTELDKNNIYLIIAESESAYIVQGLLGGKFYWKKDNSSYTGLTSSGTLTYPTYIKTDGETISYGGISFSVNDLNADLISHGISDTIKLCIGFSCKNSYVNKKLPFIYSNTIDELNIKIKWNGKTGDFLGDSLTSGNRYTDAFTNLYDIAVNNYGASGSTISNINPSDMFSTRVSNMSLDCDFIFILGGTNDWGLSAALGDSKHIEDNDYTNFYSALYNTLDAVRSRFPTKPIFVATIPQRNWVKTQSQASGIWRNANNDSIMDFNDAIKFMANVFGCVVIDSFACGITVENLSRYTDDNLHFNNAGGVRFATFAKDIMEIVTPY